MLDDKNINQCSEPPLDKSLNVDPVNPFCNCDIEPSQKDVPVIEDIRKQNNVGLGQSGLCDPMQSGNIVHDFSLAPNRNVIYRYSKAKRGCDEAVKDLFTDIVVIDEQGTAHPVPII